MPRIVGFYQDDGKIRPITSKSGSNYNNTRPSLSRAKLPTRACSPMDRISKILYNPGTHTQHHIVLTTKAAKKNLDTNVGEVAEGKNKKYVVLSHNSNGYEWHAFNNDNDWESVGRWSPNINDQVSEDDAIYLLRYGKRRST